MPKSIIVVGKDLATRVTTTRMLEALQHYAVGVGDAKAATSALDSFVFDVMVISLDRGDQDGTGIAMDVKAFQRQSKVIVVSGSIPPHVLDPFVDAYVQKPFTIREIGDAVRSVMANGGRFTSM